jgi:subtilisin-like proprotein convertase family protein
MNIFRLIFLAIAFLFAGLAQGQTLTNYTFTSGTLNAAIPDGSAVGITEVASVGVLPGLVTNVTVNLDITGGFNGDLYAYLTGPDGQIAILLNRVGVATGNSVGYSDAGFNITLANGLRTSTTTRAAVTPLAAAS